MFKAARHMLNMCIHVKLWKLLKNVRTSKARVTLDKCQLSGNTAQYTLYFPQPRAQKNAIFTSLTGYIIHLAKVKSLVFSNFNFQSSALLHRQYHHTEINGVPCNIHILPKGTPFSIKPSQKEFEKELFLLSFSVVLLFFM